MFMERSPSDRLLRATASLAIYSQKGPPSRWVSQEREYGLMGRLKR